MARRISRNPIAERGPVLAGYASRPDVWQSGCKGVKN